MSGEGDITFKFLSGKAFNLMSCIDIRVIDLSYSLSENASSWFQYSVDLEMSVTQIVKTWSGRDTACNQS